MQLVVQAGEAAEHSLMLGGPCAEERAAFAQQEARFRQDALCVGVCRGQSRVVQSKDQGVPTVAACLAA